MLTKDEIKDICVELIANLRQEQLKENVRKLEKELYMYVSEVNINKSQANTEPSDKPRKKWGK